MLLLFWPRQPPTVRRWRVWSLFVTGLCLGACAAEDPLREQIHEASRDGRPWSGRLSAEVLHRPAGRPFDAVPTDFEAMNRRETALRGFVNDAEPAASRYLVGVLDLTFGELDKAIDALRSATLDSGDPATTSAVHADLAVALLTRWDIGRRDGVERPLDLLDALDAIERAATLDPDDPAIRFDRALILDHWSLRRQARQAWQDYLAVSTGDDPGWIAEAEAALARLDQPTVRERFLVAWDRALADAEAGSSTAADSGAVDLVREFPFFSRLWTEEHLLAAWGAEPSTVWRFDLAREIAAALATERGDHLLADAVATIDAAPPETRASLAEAHRRYGAGMVHYRFQRFDGVTGDLDAARAVLDEAGSPFADWAAFYWAVCAFDDTTEAEVLALFEHLATKTDPRYPSLAARGAWLHGTARGSADHYDDALDLYARARELLDASAGPTEAVFLHAMDAEIHSMRGEVEATWRSVERALAGVVEGGRPRRLHATLTVAAQALLRQDRPALALRFLDEPDPTDSWYQDRPAVLGELLAERARAYQALGEADAARRTLDEALAAIDSQLDDAESKQRGWTALYRGHLLAEDDPDAAVEVLTEALAQLAGRAWTFGEARHLVGRARAHRLRGDLDSERRDLWTAIERYETTRAEARDASVRTRHFRLAQPAFDRLLERAVDEDPASAFDLFERSRARYLRERRGVETPSPPSLPARRPDAVVVVLAALDDAVIAWVGEGPGWKFSPPVRLSWRTEERDAMLSTLHQDLDPERLSPSPTTRLDALYARLVAPLDLPDDGRPLVVVADRELAEVPWGALRDATTGRYLVEARPVYLLPAASFLAEDRPAPAAPPSVLAVDGSAFVPQAGLDPLSRATDETRAVASLYPAGTLLDESNATTDALLDAIDHHAVLHVSAHAVAHAVDPGRARLFLAPADPDDDGVLLAGTLWQRDLGHLELVVLSACESMAGQGQGREALYGLAGGFFAAGARQVVATLWSIDDRYAHALTPRFHQEYLETRDAGIAWRRTVVEILDEPSAQWLAHPAAWAPFAVLGPPSDGVGDSVH